VKNKDNKIIQRRNKSSEKTGKLLGIGCLKMKWGAAPSVCFVCAVVLSLPLIGCRLNYDALLIQAWDQCESLKYEEAEPLVRSCLRHRPRNAVAHYLLGKCYASLETPELTLAKGQFDMARYLFDNHGDLAGLTDRMTPSEFQATLHCDTALILMRTVVAADQDGMPLKASLPVLRTALDHARKGLYFNPDSEFLQALTYSLDRMIGEAEPDTPESPAEPPAKERFLITQSLS
jgi:hypothetical protein